VWTAPEVVPLEPLSIHPAAHALHYGSAGFEGLKAHRGVDGVVRIFRLDRHIARLQQSAEVLVLPVPDADLLTELIVGLVRNALPSVPEPPGSLYLRPTLIGTEANIGAAGHPSNEALLFVLGSPVGDYFAGGGRPLVLDIETARPRTGPGFGRVKTGANYVMALGPTLRAAAEVGADQILFAPDGMVEETGASNFLLIDGDRVVTPALTDGFLHGVTRDALLVLAVELGYQVEERTVTVDEVLDWAGRPDAEAALSGTAAVLAPVGELVLDGRRITVGSGEAGRHTALLRAALTDVQTARRPDLHGWLTPVEA
jgi:branched-chain amino acid aminotransferase